MNSVQKVNPIVSNLQVEVCHKFLLCLNSSDIFKTAQIFKLPNIITDCHYFWRLKYKVDNKPLKLHQLGENFEKYKQNFQCTEQAYYTYLYELRKIWLTKSWDNALKLISNTPVEMFIIYADQRYIVRCNNMTKRYDIIDTTTNKVISKFKTRKHWGRRWKVQFPFVIGYDSMRNEIFVWNAYDQKVLWKHQYSTTFEHGSEFCANDNMIAATTNSETNLSLINITSGTIEAILPHATDTEIREHDNEAYAVIKGRDIYSQIINLKNGSMDKFESNLKYQRQDDYNIVFWKSKVIFFDVNNNVKMLDCATNTCSLKKEYNIEIEAVSVNTNFIFLITLYDIRLLEHESWRELRIIEFKPIFWLELKDLDLSFLKVEESKLIFEFETKYDVYGHELFQYQFTLDFNV